MNRQIRLMLGAFGVALVVAGTATLLIGHGGNADLIHACVRNTGAVRISSAAGACQSNETAVDWPGASAFQQLQAAVATLQSQNVAEDSAIATLQSQVVALQNALAAETTARTAADANESASRVAADGRLQAALDALQGTTGTTTAYTAAIDGVTVLSAEPTDVLSLSLPAGSYLLNAVVQAGSTLPGDIPGVVCRLAGSGQPRSSARSYGLVSIAYSVDTMPLAGPVTLNAPDVISVVCFMFQGEPGFVNVGRASIAAIKIGSLQ
jgi:hypothetical protein